MAPPKKNAHNKIRDVNLINTFNIESMMHIKYRISNFFSKELYAYIKLIFILYIYVHIFNIKLKNIILSKIL